MNAMQLLQMVGQLKSNPMQFLGQFGVPGNISSDPKSVIQHLMNNGKITQDQYDAAVKQAQNLGFRF